MIDLNELNAELSEMTPQKIIEHFYKSMFGDRLVMATSFGIDSAVTLHMVKQIVPKIKIIFVDTGYLFSETHQHAENLRNILDLDVRVFYGSMSPEEMEKVHGKLWNYGDNGIKLYNSIRKVEPFRNAIHELKAAGIIHGVRQDQTKHRSTLRHVERGYDGTLKVHPILNWSTVDVRNYIQQHALPEHPLFSQGYGSVGDTHSTKPGEGRFGREFGEGDECGINLSDYQI